MNNFKDMANKKKLLNKGGAGATQKRVEPNAMEVRKGSQISIYFDADDMELLTQLKYHFPDVPRGKILKYALGLLREEKEKRTITTSELMGYKD